MITGSSREKAKPPSLVGLCLGVIGKHLEDIIEDLGEIAASFPADIKVVNLWEFLNLLFSAIFLPYI